jgi:hypothetical protein
MPGNPLIDFPEEFKRVISISEEKWRTISLTYPIESNAAFD